MKKYIYVGYIFDLVKRILKLLNLQYFFRLVWIFFTDIFSENLVSSNYKYKNIHKGKTCFILGTGGSINNIDFECLKNEVVFGSNFLINHKDLKKLNLNYYFEIDPIHTLFLSDKNSIPFSNIIEKESDLNPYKLKNKNRFYYKVNPYSYFKEIEKKLNTNTTLFFNSSSKNFIIQNSLFNDFNISYIKGLKPMIEAKKQIFDISRRTTFNDGCIHAMIGTALFMGFKKIYLIGADYALRPSMEYHFYDQPKFSKNANNEDIKKLIASFAKINNVEVKEIHEDELFYKPIFVQRNKDYKTHKIIKRIANNINVNISLITPKGFESPIYDKVSWIDTVEIMKKKNRC